MSLFRQSESRSHFGGPLGTLEPQPERAKASFINSWLAAINLFTPSLSDAAKTNTMAWALHALTSAASSRGAFWKSCRVRVAPASMLSKLPFRGAKPSF